MYADIGILILFWMKIIIVFASALAGLIFGILIASNKVKSTKVLGIGIIISAAASIVSNAHNFLIRYVNIEVYARYATLSSIVTLIATFAGAICTCVFIHKNYGIASSCRPHCGKLYSKYGVKQVHFFVRSHTWILDQLNE